MSEHVKQVIVMRTDLNMRKGKMAAQAGHACIGAYENCNNNSVIGTWNEYGTTKICVGVDSEDELLDALAQAQKAKLPFYLVRDSGKTEFGGVATITCIAIGPWWADEIDKITGKMRLI